MELSKKKKKKKYTKKYPKAGQPEKYKNSFTRTAYRLALLGLTNQQMAEILEISRESLNVYMQKYKKFSDAIHRGKAIADAEIANSLYHRAKGYEKEEEELFTYRGDVVKGKKIKHYAPDTTAATFWLRARQPELWRDRVEIDIHADTKKNVQVYLPDNGRTVLDSANPPLDSLPDANTRQLPEPSESNQS